MWLCVLVTPHWAHTGDQGHPKTAPCLHPSAAWGVPSGLGGSRAGADAATSVPGPLGNVSDHCPAAPRAAGSQGSVSVNGLWKRGRAAPKRGV